MNIHPSQKLGAILIFPPSRSHLFWQLYFHNVDWSCTFPSISADTDLIQDLIDGFPTSLLYPSFPTCSSFYIPFSTPPHSHQNDLPNRLMAILSNLKPWSSCSQAPIYMSLPAPPSFPLSTFMLSVYQQLSFSSLFFSLMLFFQSVILWFFPLSLNIPLVLKKKLLCKYYIGSLNEACVSYWEKYVKIFVDCEFLNLSYNSVHLCLIFLKQY